MESDFAGCESPEFWTRKPQVPDLSLPVTANVHEWAKRAGVPPPAAVPVMESTDQLYEEWQRLAELANAAYVRYAKALQRGVDAK